MGYFLFLKYHCTLIMKKITLSIITLFAFLSVHSQSLNTPDYSVDLTVGLGQVNSGGIMFRKNFYLGARKKILIASGLRLAYANAQSVDYISAPFEITKDEAKIDTVAFGNTAIISPNLAITLGYRFNKKINFMFDIDLIGVSFGGEQSGTWRPGKNSSLQQKTPTAGNIASPTSPNLLLVGDRDRGTLSSAFTLHYNVNDKIGLKLGVGFLFTEYTTDNKLGAANNDRWRAKSFQGVFGATYHL